MGICILKRLSQSVSGKFHTDFTGFQAFLKEKERENWAIAMAKVVPEHTVLSHKLNLLE